MIRIIKSVPLLFKKINAYNFSRSLKVIDQIDPLSNIDTIKLQQLIEANNRDSMKNYDCLIGGVFARNQDAVQWDIWQTRSKRHRHAKLKRNRRKGPRHTIITNN